MARPPTLSFDRGTLLLHPPPPGKAWIDYATWDDRVERFRLPALHYHRLLEALRAEGTPLGVAGLRPSQRALPGGTSRYARAPGSAGDRLWHGWQAAGAD